MSHASGKGKESRKRGVGSLRTPVRTPASARGLSLESPGNFSGPKSCFMFAVFLSKSKFRNRNIHLKCFSCSRANYTEVIEIVLQVHCLRSQVKSSLMTKSFRYDLKQ